MLSGGQRRRVNIGVELAADPTVVFLDEPTSGLSATDALVIMKSLWSLSCLQCTVVAVIHSPRAVVFKMFSHVLLLGRGGHAVFFGPAKKVMWCGASDATPRRTLVVMFSGSRPLTKGRGAVSTESSTEFR